MAENNPVSLTTIAKFHCLSPKEFEKQYKNHISGFHSWDQKAHAENWLLFAENLGEKLSIDETAVSKDELYTIITNKQAKGGKKSLLASVAGTKTADIVEVLEKIPQSTRDKVLEVTLDMSNAMDAIVRAAFRFAMIVIDRFHVQKLITEAVQEIRLVGRRQALDEESQAILLAKKEKRIYQEIIYENGDTKKQLLARSYHLLFKSSSNWTDRQKNRADILFKEFPEIAHAYHLSMMFRNWYETNGNKTDAKQNLQKWYDKVEAENIKQFLVVAQTIKAYEDKILNYFNNRSTNASAESFNAKLKGFRALVRGVTDIKFFLFRVAKLYG
jgi:transposase